jgi:hypothetical protein
MRLIIDLVLGLWESIRETLPTQESDLGPFVAGMAWALVLFVAVLICVSWATITATGGRP